ncbi:hypothetical protein C8J56DRAFT_1166676 [Mycena floridula]|nr:hypothetical protein C8J56DRAFT_1166676 [Mycena floridula]
MVPFIRATLPSPSLRHLSVWPYLALAAIITLVLSVFLYMIYSCYLSAIFHRRAQSGTYGDRARFYNGVEEWRIGNSVAQSRGRKFLLDNHSTSTIDRYSIQPHSVECLPMPVVYDTITPHVSIPAPLQAHRRSDIFDKNNIPYFSASERRTSSKLWPIQGHCEQDGVVCVVRDD